MLLVQLLSFCFAVSSVAAAPKQNRKTARQSPSIPSSFQWTSTEPLIAPKNDGRGIAGIKDPTVVEVDGTYHVFASTAQQSGHTLVYLSFTDTEKAGDAEFHYLDEFPIGKGYRTAPQVFFEPPRLWFLVYQNGNAAYSTNKDIGNPAGWSAPQNFYSAQPDIIKQNIGNGNWVDMWLYRSSTTLQKFPEGIYNTVITLSDAKPNRLFEASCVQALEEGGYLLLVEAIGSDGARYFHSWTSSSIDGEWAGLADSEENPFARSNNVKFSGIAWTKSIGHGEVVCTKTD